MCMNIKPQPVIVNNRLKFALALVWQAKRWQPAFQISIWRRNNIQLGVCKASRSPRMHNFFCWSRSKSLRKLIRLHFKMWKALKFSQKPMVALIHKVLKLNYLSQNINLGGRSLHHGQTTRIKKISDIPRARLWIDPFWRVSQFWLPSRFLVRLLNCKSTSSRTENSLQLVTISSSCW